MNKVFEELSREDLLEMLSIYAKCSIAIDGFWFQSIEFKHGMDEAMAHNDNVWGQYAVSEARRIKGFLGLPENSGICGLRRALAFRVFYQLNKDRIEIDGNVLTYYVETCRVQSARQRKNMPFHPCKSTGTADFTAFSNAIDERFHTDCVSCYPDLTDPSCACVWRFTLVEQ